MLKTSAAILVVLATVALSGCTAEPLQERDEDTFLELVRASDSSPSSQTDAELIAMGDDLCADAAANDSTITETAELARSMADANPSSSADFVALVAEISRLLCPELE